MIQTIPLMTICNRWRDALDTSQAITDFCVAHYGRRHRVFVGINVKQPPTAADCPLIVLRPGSKVEGLQVAEFAYAISVGWDIINEKSTVDGSIVQLPGMQECDEFGQLIYDELVDVNPSYPVTRVDYELEVVEFFPHFVGEMLLQLEIEPAIGGTLSY